MLNKQTVIEKAKEIIMDVTPEMFGNPDELNENTILNTKDHNMDSMGYILIITKLEGEFNAKIPDEKWTKIQTLGDLADLIIEYQK